MHEEVSAVDSRGVELKDGKRIASGTILWAAGDKPSPLAAQLGLKTNEHGAIETSGDFTVTGAPHVWALGDCAAVPKPRGGTYAPLAQNAIREGPLLARNIVARMRGKATRNFRYRELGQMASLGNRTAVAEMPGGHMLTGRAAWIVWRAYYLEPRSRLHSIRREWLSTGRWFSVSAADLAAPYGGKRRDVIRATGCSRE